MAFLALYQIPTGDAKVLMNKLTPVFNTWKTLMQVCFFLNNKIQIEHNF